VCSSTTYQGKKVRPFRERERVTHPYSTHPTTTPLGKGGIDECAIGRLEGQTRRIDNPIDSSSKKISL